MWLRSRAKGKVTLPKLRPPAGTREGLGGQGKEFRLNSNSSGKSLIHRVENRLETGKGSLPCTYLGFLGPRLGWLQ